MPADLPFGVSVCIPVFNRSLLLKRAVESCLNQTIPPAEIIISDNASSDDSYWVASDLASRNPSIKLLRNSNNIGAIENFRRCIDSAKFRWVLLLGSDDFLSHDFIEGRLEALATAPDAKIISGPMTIYNQRNETLSYSASYKYARKFYSQSFVVNNFYKRFIISYFCLIDTYSIRHNFHSGESFRHLGSDYTSGLGLDLINILDILKAHGSNSVIPYASKGTYNFVNHQNRESEHILDNRTGFDRTRLDYQLNFRLFSYYLKNSYGNEVAKKFELYRSAQYFYEVYRALLTTSLRISEAFSYLRESLSGDYLKAPEVLALAIRSFPYTACHLYQVTMRALRKIVTCKHYS